MELAFLTWSAMARKQPSGMGLSSAVVGELLQNIVMVMVMMMIVFAVLVVKHYGRKSS